MIPALYAIIIGIALWVSRGMFNMGALAVLVIGTVIFFFSTRLSSYREEWIPKLMALATGAFILLLIVEPRIMYIPHELPMLASYSAIRIVLVLAFIAYLLSFVLPRPSQFSALAIAGMLLLYAYFLTIAAVPLPRIDVFVVDTLSADAVIAGKNPYTQPYPDLYNGAYGYAASFTYWPGLLLFTIPTRLIGDIRFATILSLIICAICIYSLNRSRGRDARESILPILLLLSFPVGFFVLEQAWIDPILAALTFAAALFLQRRRWMTAALLVGVAMATKQYGFLVTLPSLAYILREGGPKKAAQCALVTGATFLAILAPYAVSNFDSFFASTIALHVNVPNRPDSLSLPAAIFALCSVWPPSLLLLASYITAVVASIFFLLKKPQCTLYDWAFTVTALHAIIFLFGKQAFCNYYYLLAAFALLLFSVRPAPHPPKPSNV